MPRLLRALLAVAVVLAFAGVCAAESGPAPTPGGRDRASPRPEAQVRCRGEYFEVLTNGRWTPMFWRGFNIGAAPPGRFPGEFAITKEQYARWMEVLDGLGANALRVYTLHPPQFYEALAEHNSKFRYRYLWLFQGAWCDLPDDLDFYNESFSSEFKSEIRSVVDAVHGALTAPARRGHASGTYTADVSRWVAGYVVGREFEPFAVIKTNDAHPNISGFGGRYLRVEKGSASECWLAEMCDFLVGYETEKYGVAHPVSFTNWPTLDPITHPTERERGGARAYHDEDAVSLNPAVVRPTEDFDAGFFATFHAYPYYPDFMNLDPGYCATTDEHGPCNYAGYLRDLKSVLKGMPLLIGETGVPTSRGIAHFQPQGLNHGGATELEQGAQNCRITEDCYSNGTTGVLLFELFDEWFKDNWLVDDFEIPPDRDVLWQNVQDPEEFFGVLAEEPLPPFVPPGVGFVNWGEVPRLCRDAVGDSPQAGSDLTGLHAWFDSRYLYLLVELADPGAVSGAGEYGAPPVDPETGGRVYPDVPPLLIGLDILDRDRGDTRFPVVSNVHTEAGMEFVIYVESPDSAALLIDSGYNYSRFSRVLDGGEFKLCAWPFRPSANSDGKFERLIVETNRERVSASGRTYPAVHLDAGKLKHANPESEETVRAPWEVQPAEGDWRVDRWGHSVELRIPWALLNVTDPSSRSVLDDSAGTRELEVTKTPGIAVTVLALTGGSRPRVADAMPDAVREGGDYVFRRDSVPVYTWPGWEDAVYMEREKDSYYAVMHCFGSMPLSPVPGFRAKIARWPGNREAAASVSFDDGTASQVEYALPILESLGLKATFGLCGAWTERERMRLELAPGCVREQLSEADARRLRGLGHEIASHGFRHIFLDTLPETALADELRLARSSVESALGPESGEVGKSDEPADGGVAMFHYPFSRLNERVKEEVAAAGFLGARSIGRVNSASPDRYLLESVPVVSDRVPDTKAVKALLEEAREKDGWLILNYHNVLPRGSAEAKCYARLDPEEPYSVTPSTFLAHMKLLESSGFYVAPEGDVLRYILARNSARLDVWENGDEVDIKVLSGSADVKYVTKLTLVIKLPWKKVRVLGPGGTGGEVEDEVKDVVGGVIMVDAAPGSLVSVRRME